MNATRLLCLLAALSLLVFLPPARTEAAAAKKAGRTGKAAASHHVVPFIADDLDRALADAKKTNRPIFVESWAPW